MTKEEKLERLRQERITRQLTSKIVDSMYGDRYSIIFDFENQVIRDNKNNRVYEDIYNEIDVSDSIFSSKEFIDITIEAYIECQREKVEDQLYLPPEMVDVMDKIYNNYDEKVILVCEENVTKYYIEEGREDDIGSQQYVDDLDSEFEMITENIYGYECIDIENRICCVLDNYGLSYIYEDSVQLPNTNKKDYEYVDVIANSSKRLLFDEISDCDKNCSLGGGITFAPTKKGGGFDDSETLERGYRNVILATMEL